MAKLHHSQCNLIQGTLFRIFKNEQNFVFLHKAFIFQIIIFGIICNIVCDKVQYIGYNLMRKISTKRFTQRKLFVAAYLTIIYRKFRTVIKGINQSWLFIFSFFGKKSKKSKKSICSLYSFEIKIKIILIFFIKWLRKILKSLNSPKHCLYHL